ncbi:hypothetical protein ACJIZ3_007232 [Penstemon smallii]|uniref:Fe2OG dioxygenase domain-containing protein n=1 Tax=Penstemon smallii TaxID=265156 RepID=A0ABD3SA10_9LAMI
MAGGFNLVNLSFLLNLLSSSSNLSLWPGNNHNHNGVHVGVFPPTCNRIECPSYDLIHTGNDFEIRRYNSSVWISTQPIIDTSFVAATRTGFRKLFDYIQGNNDNQQKIEMTGPVITEVKHSDGPSSFVVSFYVPKKNQDTAPLAEGLHLQKWGLTYVAVRQFSGFVRDTDVGEEVAALYASVAGTVWSEAIAKSHGEGAAVEYIVAQETVIKYSQSVHELAMDIGRKLCRSIGINMDLFEGWPFQFRINKYNFTPESIGSSGVQIHTDSGFLTLLQDDDTVDGLEVMDERSGEFIAVDPLPGSILVNFGDIANVWSNGRFCNVRHRVQCKEAAVRVSIALFVLGPKEVAVEAPPELVVDSECPRLYVPFTFEEYRKLRLSAGLRAGEALALVLVHNTK